MHADPQFRLRFEREVKIIAQLEHSAIVPVYDVGESEGQPYFVMRYMNGGSLSDRIQAGRLSVEDAARILGTIAPGLDEAHSKGIVHRDIKPSNILFDRHGNPYISDFGIAKLSQAQAGNVTGSAIIGTPAYMAPDQAARWLLPEPERSAAASPATGAIIKILEHYCSRISLTRLGPR